MRAIKAAAGVSMVCGALGLMASAAPASGPIPTVINGSFEAPVLTPSFAGFDFQRIVPPAQPITGWTVGGGSVDWIRTYWQASDGLQSVDLDGNEGDTGSLTQTITGLVAGTAYRVAFDASGNPDGPPAAKPLRVSAGATQQDYTVPSGSSRPAMNYQTLTFDFVAASTSVNLTFQSRTNTTNSNPGFGAVIDNVRFVETGPTPVVPEVPMPILLTVTAVAAGGLVLLRRRTIAS